MAFTHSLLWVDIEGVAPGSVTFERFRASLEIHCLTDPDLLDNEIGRLRPDAVCFDFDLPDEDGLRRLREAKHVHRGMPILLLTAQHSDTLAAWALRSRLWNYLVKPAPYADVDRCVSCLTEMTRYREVTFRAAAQPPFAAASPGERRPVPTLARAISYIEQDFRGRVTSEKAAALCGLPTLEFCRRFKQSYGVSFQDYLLRFRMHEARRLLRRPNADLDDVACLVGFDDPSRLGGLRRQPSRAS